MDHHRELMHAFTHPLRINPLETLPLIKTRYYKIYMHTLMSLIEFN